jgi:hypothetical protein
MNKGIALIGVGETRWITEIIKDIENGQPARRIRWTYRIRDEMKSLLKQQINEREYLKILFYQTKSSGGAGHIVMVAYADDFDDIEEVKYKSEFWIDDYEYVDPPMALSHFWRLEDNRTVTPSMLRSSFAYVADVKTIETSRIDAWKDLELKERFLEDSLSDNLWLLGLGEVELVDKQMQMGESGIADIVVKKEDDTIVIVELKSGKLKISNVRQLQRYLKWAETEYDDVEGILIGWDSSKMVEKSANSLRKDGYSITIMVYDAKLRLRKFE